jgi:hypothetical protein
MALEEWPSFVEDAEDGVLGHDRDGLTDMGSADAQPLAGDLADAVGPDRAHELHNARPARRERSNSRVGAGHACCLLRGNRGGDRFDGERLRGSRAADAVAQVRDVLREFLDLRCGQPADWFEFDVFGRQVVEQSASLPEQDRYDV